MQLNLAAKLRIITWHILTRRRAQQKCKSWTHFFFPPSHSSQSLPAGSSSSFTEDMSLWPQGTAIVVYVYTLPWWLRQSQVHDLVWPRSRKWCWWLKYGKFPCIMFSFINCWRLKAKRCKRWWSLISPCLALSLYIQLFILESNMHHNTAIKLTPHITRASWSS